jgi:hypothetical protein
MLWKLRIVVAVVLFSVVPTLFAQTAPSTWPAQQTTADGQVTIFQPQLDDFQGDQLSSRAAVSVQLTGQTDPVFGAVWFKDQVAVDTGARTVRILQVSIASMKFPTPDPVVQRAVQDAVSQFFGGRQVVLNLDQLQSTLDTLHKEQAAAGQMQVDAPKIVFRDHPAVKVQYDGAPRLVQVDDSNLFRVVNTPFFVALDPGSKTYFLKGGGRWFAAPDPMGPFAQTASVPPPVSALADSTGYQDPQQPLNVDANANVEIVTATDPTELIWTDGPMQMGTIPSTDLLYVANTDADLFLTIDHPQYFALISGRWYSSPGKNGPWAFVPPDQLPGDFQKIPPESAKGGVLVSVPGTAAAGDAVADSFVPQTAAVDVSHFDQPPVAYDGDASFEPIEGTPVSYAVNTDASVLLVDGRYYCCYNAVWYEGGAAVGPWGICTSVPAVIYTIPPSCPIYPVRFVYIYGHGPGAVYFGYLPGYVGSYVYDGVVVYGTGFHYRPWVGRLYFARPYTYGFAAHYDWYTGHWGFDFGIALGGGGVWVGHGPDDHFRGAWFGYGGFHPVYARDEAHIAAAEHEIEADRARHEAVVSIYDRRADLRVELPGGRPRPIALEHSEDAALRGSHAPPPRVDEKRVDDKRVDDVHSTPPVTDRGNVDRGNTDRGGGQSSGVQGGGGQGGAADQGTSTDRRDDRRGGDQGGAAAAAPDQPKDGSAATDKGTTDKGGRSRDGRQGQGQGQPPQR